MSQVHRGPCLPCDFPVRCEPRIIVEQGCGIGD